GPVLGAQVSDQLGDHIRGAIRAEDLRGIDEHADVAIHVLDLDAGRRNGDQFHWASHSRSRRRTSIFNLSTMRFIRRCLEALTRPSASEPLRRCFLDLLWAWHDMFPPLVDS